MVIVVELAGRGVEQVQALGSTHPQVPRLVLEHRPYIVGAERCFADRVVTEGLRDAPAALHSIEAAIVGADPEDSALVLQNA